MKQKGTSLVPQYVLAPFLTNLEAEMLTPELEVSTRECDVIQQVIKEGCPLPPAWTHVPCVHQAEPRPSGYDERASDKY